MPEPLQNKVQESPYPTFDRHTNVSIPQCQYCGIPVKTIDLPRKALHAYYYSCLMQSSIRNGYLS